MNSRDNKLNQDNNNCLSLKDAFTEPSIDQWHLEADKLLSKSPDTGQRVCLEVPGFNWQPIFCGESNKSELEAEPYPGFSPFTRSQTASGNSVKSWTVLQSTPYPEPKRFNQAIKEGLEHGLTGVSLAFDRVGRMGLDPDQARVGDVGWAGLSISMLDDFSTALDGIALDKIPIHLDCGVSGLPAIAFLVSEIEHKKYDLSKLRGCLTFDPLGVLATDGSLPVDIRQLYDELELSVKWSGAIEGFTSANISTVPYQETGLSAPEQLGCLLATGVAYLKEMEARGISFEQFQKELSFSLSVGSNLFVEIAKLRACRMVWSRLMELCEIPADTPFPQMHLHSLNSSRTLHNQQVNILRATIETFASIVGGCDSLKIAPLDQAAGLPDKFSLRMACNAQLILAEESHLNAVIDPAGGSHYIERLTESIAEQAWNKFIEIEMIGGMLHALETGLIQQWTTETVSRRIERLVRRKDVIVGSSKYINLSESNPSSEQIEWEKLHNERADQLKRYKNNIERLLDKLNIDKLTESWLNKREDSINEMVVLAQWGATVGELAGAVRSEATGSIRIGALIPFRPAELFENLRNSVDNYRMKHGDQPAILLAPIGNSSRLQPRIEFTRDYLAVAGYQTQVDKQYVTADEAIYEIEKNKPALVVIIASDKDYPDLIPAMCALIKEKSPQTVIALAGYPEEQIDSFTEAGISEFIYEGADIYAGLSNLSQQLGVLR